MLDWPALFAASLRWRGVVHVEDGRAFGISPAAVSARADRERWHRPYPGYGVVIVPGSPHGYERDVCAALKAVGGERVLAGHRTAAHLHGFLDRRPPMVELLVPHDRRPPSLPGVMIRTTRTLLKSDAGDARGIPATTPARTAVDLAGIFPVPQLRSALIDGAQRRYFRLDDVEEIRHRVRPCPGGPKLDRVLRDLRKHGSDSDFEFQVRRFLHHHGFEPYPRPFPFRTSRGRIVHFDIAFPAQWVCCECDSLGHHSDRVSFQQDRWKWSQAQIDGWAVYWIEWTRWQHDPLRIVHDLRALLAAADLTRPPATPAV